MKRSESGFTLVELLLAMGVFSFMLVLVSSGYIYLVHIYQAGLASRTTQQNSRNIIDSVNQTVRSSSQAWIANQTLNGVVFQTLCLNSQGTIVEYAVVDEGAPNHFLDLYRGVPTDSLAAPNCPIPASVAGWSKLNDDTVNASLFRAQVYRPFNGILGSTVVTVGLAARSELADVQMVNPGTPDVRSTGLICNGGINTQFCAVTTLTSAADLRGAP